MVVGNLSIEPTGLIHSPVGDLSLLTTQLQNKTWALAEIRFVTNQANDQPYCSNAFTEQVIQQIEQYFAQEIFTFSLPLLPLAQVGSPFRCQVWQQIQQIPRGQTQTYGNIAKTLGASAQSVGSACGDNPYPLIIPCHRVVAKNRLGGFAHHSQGRLLDVKAKLLHREGVILPIEDKYILFSKG